MSKTLIIFGASGSLGKAVTGVMLRKNFGKIFLPDRHPERLEFSGENIVKIKVEDLTSEENVEKIFVQIPDNPGNELFLFSTVGGYFGGKEISETPFEEWQKMQTLNLNIAFLLGKYFAKKVKNFKSGSVLFTSAITSFLPEAGKVAYGVSKAGLNYLVETLAKEGRKSNFTANAIAPFALETVDNRQWFEDKTDLISPEKIGELVFAIFENYEIISGNIVKLPFQIK